jgi:hypothetical protein
MVLLIRWLPAAGAKVVKAVAAPKLLNTNKNPVRILKLCIA